MSDEAVTGSWSGRCADLDCSRLHVRRAAPRQRYYLVEGLQLEAMLVGCTRLYKGQQNAPHTMREAHTSARTVEGVHVSPKQGVVQFEFRI
jgi:hypothetical protein